MRVLFLAGYTHPAYHRKIEFLADTPDVEILHVTVDGYDRTPGIYPSASGQRAYQVVTYPARWLGPNHDSHRSFLWTADLGMQAFRPDIVHVESDVETLGSLQVALTRRLFAPQSKLLLYSWQNLLRPRRFYVRQVVNYNLHAADHIVCSSSEAVDVLRRQGYQHAASVMPLMGVDTRIFTPALQPDLQQRLALSAPVIGYIGRLVPEKGIDTLLHAFAQVTGAGELLVVGDGPHESELRALAYSLGIAARCRFVPVVSYTQVADYLNLMDVLVLPSRTTLHWKEQFGRVLVEAMGCGVAVVGSDSGAIPEVMGSAGLVFEEGDAAALTAILAQLTADPALRRAKAAEGWQRVQDHYTVERIAQQLLGVWRSLSPNAPVADSGQ